MIDPVFLKPSKEMDVVQVAVAAFAILFLAPLAAPAPVEVPVVQQFHEDMINSDNATEIFNARVLDVVEELNVTSDTVMGYPNDARDFLDEIRNGDDNGANLAATMMPYIILFFIVLFGVIGALCTACYCGVKKIVKEWKKSVKKDATDTGPNEIVVMNDNERVDATRSTPPSEINDSSEDSVYTINVYHKTEYIPQDRSYFI